MMVEAVVNPQIYPHEKSGFLSFNFECLSADRSEKQTFSMESDVAKIRERKWSSRLFKLVSG